MSQSSQRNCPADSAGETPEDGSNPLNTYKWHTGAKSEAGGQGTLERLEKGAANKWSKMQNWRKALSEDSGEKSSSSTAKAGENPSKAEKPASSRKNPFRRALSEPPGALLSSVLSQSTSASGTSSAEAPGDTAQKGKLRKYLQQVSQKLKRQRLQRNSSPITENGEKHL